jgi:hypothetical protein
MVCITILELSTKEGLIIDGTPTMYVRAQKTFCEENDNKVGGTSK